MPSKQSFLFIGFTIFGILCLATAQLTRKAPLCSKPIIPNGEFKIEGTFAIITCKEGYRLNKPGRILCVNRQWNPNIRDLKCEREEGCPNPPDIPHGQIIPMKKGSSYLIKDEIRIHCDPNHRAVKGETYLQCVEGLKWSGEFPVCEETCLDLPNFENGQWGYRDKDVERDGYFVCNKGFQLVQGLDGKKCIRGNRGLEWIGNNPKCEQIPDFEHNIGETVCPKPPKLLNGKILPDKVGKDYYPGEEIQVVCDPTYTAVGGSSILRCQNSGEWDDEFPKCEDVTCEVPEEPDDGIILELKDNPKRLFKFADIITYECNQGFKLVGQKKRMCSDAGWSFEDSTCVEIKCGPLPELSYSRPKQFQRGKKWFPGDDIELECLFGFRPVKRGTRLHIYCDENGIWDSSAADCEAIFCDPPKEIENGRIDFDVSDNKFSYGTQITYSCKNKLALVGKATMSCTEKGWSDELPVCKDFFCERPEIDDGLSIQTNPGNYEESDSFPVGTEITYKCPGDNYNMVGSHSQICSEGGWTGRTPFCQLLGCSIPEPPENGRVYRYYSYNKIYRFGDYAHFTCSYGHKFENDRKTSAKCNEDGTWTEIPKCIEVSCKIPPPVENGKFINLLRNGEIKYPVNYVITLKCNEGYTLKRGTGITRKCVSNGHWSDRQQYCEKIRCDTPPDFPHAEMVTDIFESHYTEWGSPRILKVFEADFKILYKCQDRYQLVIDDFNQPEITCLKTGQWSKTEFRCEISCGQLPKIKNGRLTLEEPNKMQLVNSIAFVACDNNFDATTAEISCQPDGRWNADDNICIEKNVIPGIVSCGRLPSIKNGFLTLEDQHNIPLVDSRAFVYCNNNFQSVIHCQEDGQWNVDYNICHNKNEMQKIVSCGQLPRILNGYLRLEYYSDVQLVGSRAFVSCDKSFVAIKSEVFCEQDGQWNVDDRICQELNTQPRNENECGPVPLIKNGVINAPAGMKSFPIGTTSNVVCLSSYTSSSFIVKCERGGVWNMSDVSCDKPGKFCGIPPMANNVIVRGQNNQKKIYSLGDQIEYGCVGKHSDLSDPTINICTINGWYQKTSPTCIEKKCESVPPINNGRINPPAGMQSFPVGTTANVICKKNYFSSSYTVICQDSGTWNTTAVNCKKPDSGIHLCDSLPSLKNGILQKISSGPVRPFELSVLVDCNPGYRTMKEHIACDQNGQWNIDEIKCVRDKTTDCTAPDELENGFIERIKNSKRATYPMDYNITYRCSSDYTLVGEPTRVCTDGGWSGEVPECRARFCSSPKINGMQVNQLFQVGDKYQRNCPEGEAVLKGNAIIQCLEGGIWSGELPECERYNQIQCPIEPFSDERGQFEPSVDLKLKLVCPEGSIPLNSNVTSSTCDDRAGEWIIPIDMGCVPLKIDKSCDKVDAVQNGVITGLEKEKFEEGEKLSLICNKGFTIAGGVDHITCLKNGYWDRNFGECQAATCDVPLKARHGDLEPKDTEEILPFGQILNARCDYGYKLTGKSILRCTENGWDQFVPMCRKIMCPNPGTPDNGWYHGSFNFRDRLTFGCFSGYTLYGSKERICLENGKWSGQLTVCDSNKQDCPEPGTPSHGLKTGSTYNEGDIVSYVCESGYTLVGSRVRTCKQRKWTGQEPQCLGKNDFDDANEVSQNLKSLLSKLKEVKQKQNLNRIRASPGGEEIPKEMLLVICYIFDTSSSIGKQNFLKTLKLAKAISQNLGVLQFGGKTCAITFDTEAHLKIPPRSYNNINSLLTALDSIPYQEGKGTSLESAFDVLSEKVCNATFRENPDKNVLFVTFLFTDGKVKQSSRLRKNVRNLRREYNFMVYSIALTGFPNKDMLFAITSSYRHGKRSFLLDSYSTIDRITKDLMGSNQIDYSVCGKGFDTSTVIEELSPLNETEGLDSASYQLWPWTARILYVKGQKSVTPRCLGSLISSDMVLTSSLCFHKDEDPSKILIKVGVDKYHVSFADKLIEVGTSPSAPKATIIKLKKQVTFSKFTRPVCLTGKQMDEIGNKSPSSIAYSSSWSKNLQEGRYGNIAKVHLKIPSNDECKESARELGTDTRYIGKNLFCAGSKGAVLEVCGVDLGSPIMKYHIDSSNQPQWVQTGIAMAFTKENRNQDKDCYNPSPLYNIFLDLRPLSDSILEIIKDA